MPLAITLPIAVNREVIYSCGVIQVNSNKDSDDNLIKYEPGYRYFTTFYVLDLSTKTHFGTAVFEHNDNDVHPLYRFFIIGV